MRVASVAGVRRETAMSGIVLRVAQVVGVLVLAGIAIGIVVGFVQSLLGLALIVSIPLGAWWLYRQAKARDARPAVTGRPAGRRAELESRCRDRRGGTVRVVRVGEPAQGRLRFPGHPAHLPPGRDRRDALSAGRPCGPVSEVRQSAPAAVCRASGSLSTVCCRRSTQVRCGTDIVVRSGVRRGRTRPYRDQPGPLRPGQGGRSTSSATTSRRSDRPRCSSPTTWSGALSGTTSRRR